MNRHRALAKEVAEAEQRLRVRQHELRAGARSLDVAVRKRITSPDVLLWSVAGGFLLGELTRKSKPANAAHKPSAGRDKHEQHEEGHEEHQPGTLQLLLRYLAIARPIIASVTEFVSPWWQRMQAEAQTAQQAATAEPPAKEPVAEPTATPASSTLH